MIIVIVNILKSFGLEEWVEKAGPNESTSGLGPDVVDVLEGA